MEYAHKKRGIKNISLLLVIALTFLSTELPFSCFNNALSAEKQEFPPIKALFDQYHYTTADPWGVWFEDTYPGELTAYYLTSPLTYEELKEYDIFLTYLSWKPDLGPQPTASEVEALERYVQHGGGVMLMGDDPYWGMWTNVYCNILSEPYNIVFNDDQLLDPTDYDITVTRPEDNHERHIVFHNMTEHPVTVGVNSFWVHGTCSLVVNNPDAVVVVAGDDDTYSDCYPGYPTNSYPPAVVALEHGLGRIIFAGDCSGFKHDVYDNRTFILNILAWLSGSLEDEGPITAITSVKLKPPKCPTSLKVKATVDDSITGGSNIQAVEYFVDILTADGTGTPMAAQDGSFDSVTENINTVIDVTGLSPGLHTLYIHGQDAIGNWGAFKSVSFVISCSGTAEIQSETTNRQMRPLAQYNLAKAEELAKKAQDLLSQAKAKGVDTVGCEELMEKGGAFLTAAQDYFKGGYYIAANTNALSAIEVYNEAIELLKDMR